MRRYAENLVTPATAEFFSGLVNRNQREARILEKQNPFVYPSTNVIIVRRGTILSLFNAAWRTFEIPNDVLLTSANIDVGGSFQVGVDYYVYLVDSGPNGTLVISPNSTFPLGQSADNSRRIGGFHFGHIRHTDARRVPISGAGTPFGTTGTHWHDNVSTGIVDNSVWDLTNRPACSPEGMVRIGDIWVDIYLASAAEFITFEGGTNGLHVAAGALQSRYGQIPVSGTEGLNWYGFGELAARAGKRLLTYSEWVQAACGNPQGLAAADTYGWTKTTNTGRTRTGCQVNPTTGAFDPAAGVKSAAISAYNVVDTVGNVWEWLDELSNRHDTTLWSWHNVLGAGKGQAAIPNSEGLAAYMVGARWDEGILTGPRATLVRDTPWGAQTHASSRLACGRLRHKK